MFWFFGGFALLCLGVFIWRFKVNRTNLITSFMFLMFWGSLAGALFVFAYEKKIGVLLVAFGAIFILLIFLMAFGIYLLIAMLFLNARVVMKRERRSLANSLSLILGIALTLAVIVFWTVRIEGMPKTVYVLFDCLTLVILYFIAHSTLFVVSVFLNGLSRPRKDQDYIIVLGCGLKDGKASPMLARRIDKAIDFYRKQSSVGKPPKLVMSGGQGRDESRPEAEAMVDYARQRGIPDTDLLCESKSASTAENMRFSLKLMREDADGKPVRCIFASNGYHLLRAGIYARKAGLPIHGIGAKTARYYLPNAVLREYIAYLAMHPKRFAICCALLMLARVALAIATAVWT
jgi:uncharacterized SAM-binding protein YcdF (DUF218 family)